MSNWRDISALVLVIACFVQAAAGLIPAGVSPDDAEAFYTQLREAVDLQQQGDEAGAASRIAAARQIAGMAYHESERDLWYLDILDARIEMGQLEAARNLVALIQTPSHRHTAWCRLAGAHYAAKQARAGDEAVAQAVAMPVANPIEQVMALLEVARRAEGGGHIDAAKRIAGRVETALANAKDIETRAKVLGELCILLEGLGEGSRAERLIDNYPAMDNEVARLRIQISLYAGLARARTRLGKADAAAKAFEALTELLKRVEGRDLVQSARPVIEAYLASGQVEAARKLVSGLRDMEGKVEAWLLIAMHLQKDGTRAEDAGEALRQAAAMARRLDDDGAQQQVLLRIVRAMNQLSMFSAANEAAAGIRLPQHRAMAYWLTAEAQHAAGRADGAAASYEQAREAIEADKLAWRRELAWKHLKLSLQRTEMEALAETWASQSAGRPE